MVNNQSINQSYNWVGKCKPTSPSQDGNQKGNK